MKTSLKEIILSKLSLQIAYFVANFSSSTLVSFLVKEKVQTVLGNVFVNASLQPGAQAFLDKYLTTIMAGGMMVSGEVVIHFFHDKVMLPHVVAPNIPAVQAIQECAHTAKAE